MRISSAMKRKATNEEAIKDVWDAQSVLTEAIQILSDFYAKVIQSDFARLESETTEAEFEAGSIFDEFTGKAVEGAWDSMEAIAYDSHLRDNSTGVICEYLESSITGHLPANLPNSGAGGDEYCAGGLRGYPSSSGWKGTTIVCLPCER